MIVISILKILTVVVICAYASISDIRIGIINNKYLLVAFLIGLLLNIIDCFILDKETVVVLVANIAQVWLISILMYLFHVWAGGDCKFVITVSLLIPEQFYPKYFGELFSLILFLAFAFAFSYLYLIVDSIIFALKRHKTVSGKKVLIGMLAFAKSCITNLTYVIFFNSVITILLPNFSTDFRYAVILMNICLVLIISGIKLMRNKYLVMVLIVADIVISVAFKISIFSKLMLINYLIVCATLIFKLFIDEYNYDIIETKDIKAGMILSATTVLQFTNSHVKGLPSGTSEDLRSRLSPSEAESVRRWEKSKFGAKTVQIVRKIPFAVFISLGAVVFLILGSVAK